MANAYNVADKNIRTTYFLMSAFLIIVTLFGLLISYIYDTYFILFAAIIYAIISVFASYWWSDKIVLGMMNAKEIQKQQHPELYRLVENLCITAGLPLPKIYILEEAQPNAFATGRNPENAAVAFTTGLLKKLERTELEAVVAHELSHIKNRDIFIGSAVVVLVAVVSVLARAFLSIGAFSGSDRNKGGLLALLAIIAAILLPIVAMIIRFAISRKREFLADSSAVLLTRYPEGMANALKKISSDYNTMKRANEQSTHHLFIASPVRGQEKTSWFNKLFMTHPPINERIKAIMGNKNTT